MDCQDGYPARFGTSCPRTLPEERVYPCPITKVRRVVLLCARCTRRRPFGLLGEGSHTVTPRAAMFFPHSIGTPRMGGPLLLFVHRTKRNLFFLTITMGKFCSICSHPSFYAWSAFIGGLPFRPWPDRHLAKSRRASPSGLCSYCL